MPLDPIQLLTEAIKKASVSADPAYADGMKDAREYFSGLIADLGFEVEIIKTDKHPIILAERGASNEDWPHILIYGHYDVQPADPFELWTSPPFEPEIRDGRIFGRGAADNKGPLCIQIAALSHVLEQNPKLPLRITWMIEGEEEISGPSMPWFLENYSHRLSPAQILIVSDTSCPDTEHLGITTGLRGITSLEATLTGPRMDLHSGSFGGAVINPLRILTQLCASLHNVDGSVNIPGFYDNIEAPGKWEHAELKKLPMTEQSLKEMIGVDTLKQIDGHSPLEAIRFQPTLEFNGLGGGYLGEGAKTIIPSKGILKISCRLVPGQDPDKIQQLVANTLIQRCPKGVLLDVKLGGGNGIAYGVNANKERSLLEKSPNCTAAKAFNIVHEEGKKIWGKDPIYIREGGSIPVISELCKVIKSECLMPGFYTPTDNLHSPDESLHIETAKKATELYISLFTGLAN